MNRHLYHVTYLYNLPGISRHGLQPGSGKNYGEGYRAYSKGKLFLTEGDGIRYWATRLEDLSHDKTDHPEEGWIPVVIRITTTREIPMSPDKIGTSDSLATAWITTNSIPATELEVWNGQSWEPINQVNDEQMLWETLSASEEIFEDDTSWWELDYELFLPPEEEI